jgi:hypothetical protein
MSEEPEYIIVNKTERRTTSKIEIEVSYKGDAVAFTDLFQANFRGMLGFKVLSTDHNTEDKQFQVKKLKYRRKGDHLAVRELLKSAIETTGLTYTPPNDRCKSGQFSLQGSYSKDDAVYSIYLYPAGITSQGSWHHAKLDSTRAVLIFERNHGSGKHNFVTTWTLYRYEVPLAADDASQRVSAYIKNIIDNGPPMGEQVPGR